MLLTSRSVDDHRGRMNAVTSIHIPLNSPKYPDLQATIDQEDAELVSQYRWNPILIGDRFYVASTGSPRIYLHRLIMKPDFGMVVDHINGDGLDNRRENLRTCTQHQNTMNGRLSKNNTTGFIGVTQTRSRGKVRSTFVAKVEAKGKRRYLCGFSTAEDAARARDDMAREEFGEYAVYNFPRPGERGVN